MSEKVFDEAFVKEYYEKEKIKKASNRICLTLIITSAVMVLWSYAVRFVFSVFGLDIRHIYNILKNSAGVDLFQIFISVLAFLPAFFILLKVSKIPSKDLGYNLPKEENLTAFLLFGMASTALINICTTLGGMVFKGIGINYEANLNSGISHGFLGFLLSMLSTAVVPAFIEEFAMRGVTLSILRPFGDGFAIIVSSVMFGLMHGNFEQIPFTFTIGVVLSYLTVKTGSILPAMFIHFFNNGINVVLKYAVSGLETTAANIVYYIYVAVMLVLGVISVIFLKNEDLNIKSSETVLKLFEKIKCFLLSPLSLFYIVVVLIESFFIYAK